MSYLYHMVPPNMKGDTIYPLNQLKEKYPKVYDRIMESYGGREHLFDVNIPYLDCNWFDVVHMIAVDPEKIYNQLKKLGKEEKVKKWFKIDPNKLDKDKTIVYLFKNKPMDERYNEDNFEHLQDLSKYEKLPEETINYYENEGTEFTFMFIPHILYKGSISVKDSEVIEFD